jgi:hypothetical protein
LEKEASSGIGNTYRERKKAALLACRLLLKNELKNERLVAFAASAVTTTTPAFAAAAAATTESAVFLRAGFVDVECAAVQLNAVQFGDRAITFRIVAHFHEAEATRLAGVTVFYQADAIHRPISFKQAANPIFGGAEAEVAYKNILHL